MCRPIRQPGAVDGHVVLTARLMNEGEADVVRIRVLAAGVAASAVVWGLSGCSATATEGGARVTSETEGSAGEPTEPAAPAWDTTFRQTAPELAEPAVARYGRAGVEQATSLVLDFVTDHAFDQEMMKAPMGDSEAAVLAMTREMTPDAAEDWREAVKTYNTGHQGRDEVGGLLMSLTLYSAWSSEKPNTIYVAPEGPGAVNPKFTSVNTGLLDDGRLEVEVKSAAEVRLVVDKKPVRMTIDRDQTFWMKKTAEGWKIDGWTGGLKAGKYRPER